jgi:hypothetical protein
VQERAEGAVAQDDLLAEPFEKGGRHAGQGGRGRSGYSRSNRTRAAARALRSARVTLG